MKRIAPTGPVIVNFGPVGPVDPVGPVGPDAPDGPGGPTQQLFDPFPSVKQYRFCAVLPPAVGIVLLLRKVKYINNTEI